MEDTQGRKRKLTDSPEEGGTGKVIILDQNKSDNNQVGGGESSDNNYEPFEVKRPEEQNYFTLEIFNSKSFHKSEAAQEVTYRAKLKYPIKDTHISDLSPQLYALFDKILEELKLKYGPRAIARIYIDHPQLEKAIIIIPTHVEDLKTDDILDHIDNVVNSAGDIPADEVLTINVAAIKPIVGNSRKKILSVDDLKAKKSTVKIKNKDNLCLPRAIVVAVAHLNMKENVGDKKFVSEYDKVRNSRNNTQRYRAEELRLAVGIPRDRGGVLEDIPLYENYLKVSICVVSSVMGYKRVYTGNDKYNRRICLVHEGSMEEGHFDVVTKLNGLIGTPYYCEECGVGFKNKGAHNCKVFCKVCGRKGCLYGETVTCSDCNMICRSEQCYEAHKMQKKITKGKDKGKISESRCEQNWKCPDCGIELKVNQRRKELHECGEIYCNFCNDYYMDENHLCYMRGVNNDTEYSKFIFYDFECYQQKDTGQHIPNLVVAQSVCPECEAYPVTAQATCNNCGSRCEQCSRYNNKLKEYEKYPCLGCGKRRVVFKGENTSKEFGKWLINDTHKNVTATAHNARAYDAYFLYNYLVQNGNIPEPAIFSGSKIMHMGIQSINMRLLDSLNFLPMPLAKLPKAFGLTEMKKGFFPHFYNSPEHENNILPTLPDREYYDPDSMSKERREEFDAWYDENKLKPFNFQEEMLEYCISDVDILQNACMKFRKLLMQETGNAEEQVLEDGMLHTIYKQAVDPFSVLTIASVCMAVFRAKFLPETWEILTEEEASLHPTCNHDRSCICTWHSAHKKDSYANLLVWINGQWINETDIKVHRKRFKKSPVGNIPQSGYSGQDRHSKQSLQWLQSLEQRWLDEGKVIEIQHARSPSGEKIVPYIGKTKPGFYKLDGYFEYDGVKYACEYNGCNWHGCPSCFARDREVTKIGNKSLAQRYRETKLKEKRLQELGYMVITKWSCQFNTDMIQNKELRKYVQSLDIQDPINLRDCYFGGRTNALVLHKEFESGEQGHYVDFTSLYPDILKYKRFPVGHPIRVIDKFECLTMDKCDGDCMYANCTGEHLKLPYFGLMKATFLPPTDLYHPILPVKCNGKLKFPLCFKCASKESKTMCRCEEYDRCFTHTYCTPEIEVAVNMGYQILKVHEVLHWPKTEMYDTKSKKGGLFTEYINTFLKLKQQASGYPSNVNTEEEKNEYIRKYYEHEGILMARESIEKNPGLRSLSKLSLNSFYGKFGQRSNLGRNQYIRETGTLYNLLTNKSKVVTDFHIMNENVMLVEFKNSEEFNFESPNTNVLIAAFCTSWSRLKLWSVMNKLGDRVLYHDTDSIIYSATGKPEEYIPPLGEYLGDLTNELNCKEVGCNDENCTGHWIVEFVSCGPKNYTYRLNTGQHVCKVRGFSLNYRNSQVINFHSMKEALFAWAKNEKKELVTVSTEIRRNKYQNPDVYSKKVEKQYGVVYNKRVVLGDLSTVPYGYNFI